MQRSPCHPHEGSLPVLSFPQGAQKWAPRPLIQILGVLRGWSATVGGCPLAERRATIHPPGSCNPKGEGTKSLGTMQPAASGWEWGGGVSCTQPRLSAQRGGLVRVQTGSILQEGLLMLYVAETRSQFSRLNSLSPRTARRSSCLQSYSEHPGAPGCFSPQTSGWHPGSGSGDWLRNPRRRGRGCLGIWSSVK